MLDQTDIPKHVAIIMDGNGRWAKKRRLPRTQGHRRGIDRIKEITKEARLLGVKYLTIFAFSTENWDRPKREIAMLMLSLDRFLKNNLKDLHRDNIRLNVIGRERPLPSFLIKRIKESIEDTKRNSGLTLNIALNYGGRAEIVDAVKKIAKEISGNKLNIENLNEQKFQRFLYAADIPDPDLLIRTSGETRISNFLLWQLAYCELYFTKKYWPDFTPQDLKEAIMEYQERDRRYGKISSSR